MIFFNLTFCPTFIFVFLLNPKCKPLDVVAVVEVDAMFMVVVDLVVMVGMVEITMAAIVVVEVGLVALMTSTST